MSKPPDQHGQPPGSTSARGPQPDDAAFEFEPLPPQHDLSQPLHRPTRRETLAAAAASDSAREPRFRCRACGYPLADPRIERCNECGQPLDAEWFDSLILGAERDRFEHVLRLVFAAGFAKLLLIPQLMSPARLIAAILWFAACRIAGNARSGGPGGLFASGGMVGAALMFFVSFAAHRVTYYALEAMVASALLLAMLHDAHGRPLASRTALRPIAFGMLAAAPLIGAVCARGDAYLEALAQAGMYTQVQSVLRPADFLIPYVMASAAIAFCAWSLWSVRRNFLTPPTVSS